MQIAPGLYRMGGWSGGRVRAFLADDGRELTLVDTLLHHDGRGVLAELRAMGRSPRDITRIVLTHAHQSHLGGLAALKRLTGARVYAHGYEAEIISGRQPVAVPATTTLWPQRPYVTYPLQVGFVLRLGMPPSCEVDELLRDGDHVGPFTVLHIPGHSPGSLALYWPERQALIVGDAVVTYPSPALGWPAITMDNRQNRESVGKLCEMGGVDILCVGHGDPVVQGGAEVMRRLVDGKSVPKDVTSPPAVSAVTEPK